MCIAGDKVFEKFSPCDRRRTDFANNQSRGMIGKNRSLFHSGSGRDRQGERTDNRVSCATDIKDLTSDRGQMMRAVPRKQRHAFLAARDERVRTLESFEQLAPGSFKLSIIVDGYTGNQLRLALVRGDKRDRTIVVRLINLGIEKHGNAGLLSRR